MGGVTSLSDLKALQEAATPGPWKWDGVTIDGAEYVEVVAAEDDPPHGYPEMQTAILKVRDADAALIVAAVNSLPHLIAVAEAAREFESWFQLSLGSASALDHGMRDRAQRHLRAALSVLDEQEPR